MAVNKAQLPSEGSPKGVTIPLGCGSNTITSANAYRHGSVTVIELNLSNSTTTFIKVSANGALEFGGTAEMGSGTAVRW